MITLNITTEWVITEGPSREDIFDCLRLFNEHRTVNFQAMRYSRGHGHTLSATIEGIRPEDGSGNMWLLTVRFREVKGQLELHHTGTYELFYSSKYRRGTVLDATPEGERLRIQNGEIYKGSNRIGMVPGHIFS